MLPDRRSPLLLVTSSLGTRLMHLIMLRRTWSCVDAIVDLWGSSRANLMLAQRYTWPLICLTLTARDCIYISQIFPSFFKWFLRLLSTPPIKSMEFKLTIRYPVSTIIPFPGLLCAYLMLLQKTGKTLIFTFLNVYMSMYLLQYESYQKFYSAFKDREKCLSPSTPTLVLLLECSIPVPVV